MLLLSNCVEKTKYNNTIKHALRKVELMQLRYFLVETRISQHMGKDY